MLEEAARLRASLIGEKKIAEQRLNSIRSSVSGLQSDSDTLNTAQIQLRALQREADATREVFEAFLSRYKETAQLDYDRAQARVRSEERRGGKEGVSTGRTRWAPEHSKK